MKSVFPFLLLCSLAHGAVCPTGQLNAHVYGDFAYARGLAVIRSHDGKPPLKSRFTDIFVYRDGRWQCVAGHESHFPQGH